MSLIHFATERPPQCDFDSGTDTCSDKQSRKPPRSDLVRRLGALTGLHCTTTTRAGERKPADAVLAQLQFSALEAETERSVRTSGQRVVHSLSTDRRMKKKRSLSASTESRPGSSRPSPQPSQSTRSGTCCSCDAEAQKMRSAFVAASQYL